MHTCKTVRDLINELVKYDPRIKVEVNNQPIKTFQTEIVSEDGLITEKLEIKT